MGPDLTGQRRGMPHDHCPFTPHQLAAYALLPRGLPLFQKVDVLILNFAVAQHRSVAGMKMQPTARSLFALWWHL